jgi:predicted nucleic acid-binding protein
MLRAAAPLLFTPLHRLEVRNALRNAVVRGELTEDECRAAFDQLDEDLEERLLVHAAVAWTNAFRRADELSQQGAAQHGQRSIDLLHVAIALECEATTFLSFDRRQRKLAEATGLKVRP